MPLDPDEIRRRIVAARELIGMTQGELAALVEEEGYGKHDVGRLERMDPNMRLTPGRRAALSKHLRVPEAWFTAQRDTLFSEISDQVDAGPQLSRFLDEIREVLDDYRYLSETATPRQSEELRRRAIERGELEDDVDADEVVERHRQEVSEIVADAEEEQSPPSRSSRTAGARGRRRARPR